MNKKVVYLVAAICLLFWPIGLYLSIPLPEYSRYLLAVIIVGASFRYRFLLLTLPFIDPKLALVPPIFFLLRGQSLKYLVVSTFILIFTWSGFYQQSIFIPDHEARQAVLSKSFLYPNPFLARTFQNKLTPFITKIESNFFALTDPNNYFFGFHPSEILLDNLNLTKFPTFTIFFFLYGLIKIKNIKNLRPLVAISFGLVLSLSLVKNFDRVDLVLLVPLFYVILHGVTSLKRNYKNIFTIFSLTFILFSLIDYIYLFIEKTRP